MGRSDELFERATARDPGGVNSPVRAFGAVGGIPRFAARGEGASLEDADGRRYVDLVPVVGRAALRPRAARRSSRRRPRPRRGAPPSACPRKPRCSSPSGSSRWCLRSSRSGSSPPAPRPRCRAIRLARGATGKDTLIKFEGCYHGHADALLARGAGSGLATLGIPSTPGVTAGAARDTDRALQRPRRGRSRSSRRTTGPSPRSSSSRSPRTWASSRPRTGYLEGLRLLCDEHGALLIFDEVITGFRIARGGAQERFGVTPDLTVLGKVMGGGFPCAAFGGRRDLMEQLAPAGPVYQAGTLSGNPVAVAAGLAALDLHRPPGPLPGARSDRGGPPGGPRASLRRERDRRHDQPGRLAAQRVLLRRPGAELRRREGRGPRALRALLPPHAGTRACTCRRRATSCGRSARRSVKQNGNGARGGRPLPRLTAPMLTPA